MTRQPPPRRKRSGHADRRQRTGNGGNVVLWTLLGLVVLAAAGYASLCFVAGDKVPAGATVRGVAIGGLHAAAAESRLRDGLGPRATQPVQVSVGGVTTWVRPDDAGLSLDVPGTVHAAGGGASFLPGRLWKYFTGGGPTAPAVRVDSARLTETVSALAGQVDKDPVQGAISFVRGHPRILSAQDGQRLSRGGSRAAIIGAFLSSGKADLPVSDLPATITDAAVEQAMTSFVRPAVAGPVRLRLAGHLVRVTPEMFTRAITMKPDGRRLTPALSVDTLLTAIEPATQTVAGRPIPAQIQIVSGKPVVIASKKGITFDRADLARRFLATVVQPLGRRTVTIKGVTAQPDFTTADARRLKVTEAVSGFTTSFPYADYRNLNLARGAELITDTLLRPGEVFSFDKTVGKPTAARGFTKGYVISDGIFTEDEGGGLSQLAGTLFNAEYLAGLEDVHHEVHSVYSNRFPKGREASVDYGKVDLQFKNDSPYGVLITASVVPSTPAADGKVSVRLYSTKRYDVTVRTGKDFDQRRPKIRHRHGKGCEAAVGYPGFSVNVFREFHRPGSAAVLRTEKTTAVYEPSNTVVCDTP